MDLASPVLQLGTGQFDIAVGEARSKASNILHQAQIEAFGPGPLYARLLALHPRLVAALEMRAFLEATGNTEGHADMVVAKNSGNALRNPLAAYPSRMSVDDVKEAEPLNEEEVASYADGAIVLVLATEEAAAGLPGGSVFINGIGWAQHTPNPEEREWHRAVYAKEVARKTYSMAGITDLRRGLDFVEVD